MIVREHLGTLLCFITHAPAGDTLRAHFFLEQYHAKGINHSKAGEILHFFRCFLVANRAVVETPITFAI